MDLQQELTHRAYMWLAIPLAMPRLRMHSEIYGSVFLFVRACVCVRACVRVHICVCVCVHAYVCITDVAMQVSIS